MAELLLDQIHSQIRNRARELEPAALEYNRLEAALTALGGLGGLGEGTVPASPPPLATKRRPKTPARARGKRAPRGANRAAALAALAERPGASATELSTTAGVAKPVLYALLKTLEEEGAVAREQMPSGRAGYSLTPATSGDSASR